MSMLEQPRVAAVVATGMQALMHLSGGVMTRRARKILPEIPGTTSEITIPTSVASAKATVYRPAGGGRPPVYVNFHGGGFVMPGVWLDDPLCRFLAANAGVVVVNVDYVVAPQHPFPAPTSQAFEITRWIADHGDEHSWDGTRLSVGGQSAGGGIAAAVARQALEQGGPAIALQVLHYAPLDLTIKSAQKPSTSPRPLLRPWMGLVFDTAYAPDPALRADRLISPAGTADTADLTGIAPALVITPEHDRLHDEGVRYAQRLRAAGALVEHYDVPDADHAYDMSDPVKARTSYALIARHLRERNDRPV